MTARRVIRVKNRLLTDALIRLYTTGERRPSVAVGEYRVSLRPGSRGLYVRRARAYLGRVSGPGRFAPSPRASAVDVSAIRVLIERFTEVARGAAILSGDDPRCAVCRRPLGEADRHRGIGARCWEKGEFWRLEKKRSVGDRKSGRLRKSRHSVNKRRRPRNGR